MISFDVVIEQPVIGVEVTEVTEGVVVITGPQGPKGDPGRTGIDIQEVIVGDGQTTTYLLTSRVASSASVQVFRNGLVEVPGVGFNLSTSESSTTIEFLAPPLIDDDVIVLYHI